MVIAGVCWDLNALTACLQLRNGNMSELIMMACSDSSPVAGFVSAALCSVLVGSVHYASFCWSKRLALQAMNGGSSSSSSDNSHSANMMAASIGALATALVESPVELFRHRAQAGTVSGDFMQEMVTTVRKQVGWVPIYHQLALLACPGDAGIGFHSATAG